MNLKEPRRQKQHLVFAKLVKKKESEIPDIEAPHVEAKGKQNEIERISPKKKKVVPSDDPKLKKPQAANTAVTSTSVTLDVGAANAIINPEKCQNHSCVSSNLGVENSNDIISVSETSTMQMSKPATKYAEAIPSSGFQSFPGRYQAN